MPQHFFGAASIQHAGVDEPAAVHSVAKVMARQFASDSINGREPRTDGGYADAAPPLDADADRKGVGSRNVEDALLFRVDGGR